MSDEGFFSNKRSNAVCIIFGSCNGPNHNGPPILYCEPVSGQTPGNGNRTD